MKNKTIKTSEEAANRARVLLSRCRTELRNINDEFLGDYEKSLNDGYGNWGYVTALEGILRQLRELQGIEAD